MTPVDKDKRIKDLKQELRNTRERLSRIRAAKTIEESVKRKHYESYKVEKAKNTVLREQLSTLKAQLKNQTTWQSASFGGAGTSSTDPHDVVMALTDDAAQDQTEPYDFQVKPDPGTNDFQVKSDPGTNALTIKNNQLMSQTKNQAEHFRRLADNVSRLYGQLHEMETSLADRSSQGLDLQLDNVTLRQSLETLKEKIKGVITESDSM